MKLAATIIKGKCVDSGENLQEQKSAIRALVDKYGPGDDRVYILYSSQRPAARKRINLPEGCDAEKVYEEGKAEAKKIEAARKAALAKEEALIRKQKAAAQKARKARRDAATTGRKAKADASK